MELNSTEVEIKVGDRVVLDKKFNNASEVTITRLGKHFAGVKDDAGNEWDTMVCRLTPIDPKPTTNQNY